MKVAVFDAHDFEKDYLSKASAKLDIKLTFLSTPLKPETVQLAAGHEAICSFVNDKLDANAIGVLSQLGIKIIALRSAGFNHCDLAAAKKYGVRVARVPEYSPYAVAEHAVALLLTLNRKIHKAYMRTRELNFSLNGLVGFDIHSTSVGVIGTGKIGAAFARIMRGFGATVYAYDTKQSKELIDLGVNYVGLEEVLSRSKVLSLHVPLNSQTKHLLNERTFAQLKKDAVLINTGRGGLVDTKALIKNLKSGHLGGAALDVYEEEEGVFFEDLSYEGLKDDDLARLLTFPNVLVTAHQAFLTQEALTNIASTTMFNLDALKRGRPCPNEVLLQ